MDSELRAAIRKALAFCQANDWAGYDPYDALNSKIFRAVPLLNSRVPRLLLTQGLKRSPLNIRRLLLIPKLQNAKAIALFLSAFVKLSRSGDISVKHLIPKMVERLLTLRSPREAYWCWGYSFPWQTRTILVPAGAANLVCTSFVASALVDVYEHCGDSRCLSMAVSAAEYILNELYWSRGDSAAGFSYPQPSLEVEVHNANFLAAALLCRVYEHTGERKFILSALRVARFSAARQRTDGSWYYAEAHSQRWIDNFHTGYSLCALKTISRYAKTTEFDSYIRQGFDFYRKHFFREDGAVRYFHNRTYPIDIHTVAQSIITLVELKDLDWGNVPLAHSLFRWAMNCMWDERGFFYYRVLRFCTIRTPYMRWSQAWMFLAMCTLVRESAVMGNSSQNEIAPTLAEAC
jgi:rhamnogalacturonyl hydrolase YesR